MSPTSYITKMNQKRAAGIEPASLAWKAKVLPLNYARMFLLIFNNPNNILQVYIKVKSLTEFLCVYGIHFYLALLRQFWGLCRLLVKITVC